MKTLEQLKAELETAKQQVYEIEEQINSIADGFIYHICICSYGSYNWSTSNNTFKIQELCDEFLDGYDGLVEVYTNNANLDVKNQGCLRLYTLEELPENRKGISESMCMTNLITDMIISEEEKSVRKRIISKR